jgi:hypothetical protein
MGDLPAIVTRRNALVGSFSITIITGTGYPAAAALPAWIGAVAAGTVSGWLVEALKNWGLVPQPRQQVRRDVVEHHDQETTNLRRQGYAIKPMCSGAYSTGGIEVAEATKGDQLRLISTTSHGQKTCALGFDKIDSANLCFVAAAMIAKGLSPLEAQAVSLPIHAETTNRHTFSDNVRRSPAIMTPSHGTIALSTNFGENRPNMRAAVRSPRINSDVYVWNDKGQWLMQSTS